MKRNFFNFENLGGEYPSFAKEIRRGTPTAVFGVSDSLKYLLAGLIDYPVVYITADSISAKKAAENIAALSGKKTEVLAAKDEVLLYRKALSKDSLYQRLRGISALYKGEEIVVAEIDALIQLFPKTLPTLTFKEGEEFDFTTLPAQLTKMGYTRSFEVEMQGVYALRGDILDIYPVGAANPVRVDFFGDTVERIKPYELTTGTRLSPLREITVLSATDVIVSKKDRTNVEATLKQGLKTFKTSAHGRR